jgi:xanthine dehydrogenase molybdopterin-binding subunit B
VQHIVAHVLALPMHSVVVECPRMGGGSAERNAGRRLAALAALARRKTSARCASDSIRDQDMMITGKRHPFLGKFRVGFDENGMLLAAKVDMFSNGGWSLDLSRAITDRALFHLDNAYYIPHVEFSGRVAKTNLASNTAFRGFGGPQGMLVIEEIIDRVARVTGLAPEVVRARNLYRDSGETNTTHYGQEIEDNRIQRIWKELTESSGFAARREQAAKWNREHSHRKRGIAMTPVKFGISFTTTHLNQAGALVLLYQDGTIQVNHGGTEMGQGVYTNITLIAARELGLTTDRVRVMATRTDKVPNTSATAASCGTDLNGAAVKNACDTLRARLLLFAVEMLSEKVGSAVPAERIVFNGNMVIDPQNPSSGFPFAELVQRAYFARTSLSATGFYRTPDIYYDRDTGRGKPFHYFAVGAAVSEIEVDGFTGMTRIRRVDILHDVGDAINPGVTLGQVEGGFVQVPAGSRTKSWSGIPKAVCSLIRRTPTKFPRSATRRTFLTWRFFPTRRNPTWFTEAKPWANRRSCSRSQSGKRFATPSLRLENPAAKFRSRHPRPAKRSTTRSTAAAPPGIPRRHRSIPSPIGFCRERHPTQVECRARRNTGGVAFQKRAARQRPQRRDSRNERRRR